MIAAIRSEFRKLMTVRSTYVIIAFCLAVTVFFAFYIEGLRSSGLVTSGKLASEVTSAAQALGLFIAIAGVLMVTHEYRYNTIMYTLTSARSRIITLLAKIITVSTFSVLLTLAVCAAAPFLTQLGLNIKDINIPPQDFPFGELLLKAVYYGWGYSMLALIIAFIVRSQVGAFVTLMLFPALGESLLSLLLKENAKYLPFGTLQNVLMTNPDYKNAPWILLAYIVGGWLVAWLLFQRRDAN